MVFTGLGNRNPQGENIFPFHPGSRCPPQSPSSPPLLGSRTAEPRPRPSYDRRMWRRTGGGGPSDQSGREGEEPTPWRSAIKIDWGGHFADTSEPTPSTEVRPPPPKQTAAWSGKPSACSSFTTRSVSMAGGRGTAFTPKKLDTLQHLGRVLESEKYGEPLFTFVSAVDF